jgi:hypothetical protein
MNEEWEYEQIIDTAKEQINLTKLSSEQRYQIFRNVLQREDYTDNENEVEAMIFNDLFEQYKEELKASYDHRNFMLSDKRLIEAIPLLYNNSDLIKVISGDVTMEKNPEEFLKKYQQLYLNDASSMLSVTSNYTNNVEMHGIISNIIGPRSIYSIVAKQKILRTIFPKDIVNIIGFSSVIESDISLYSIALRYFKLRSPKLFEDFLIQTTKTLLKKKYKKTQRYDSFINDKHEQKVIFQGILNKYFDIYKLFNEKLYSINTLWSPSTLSRPFLELIQKKLLENLEKYRELKANVAKIGPAKHIFPLYNIQAKAKDITYNHTLMLWNKDHIDEEMNLINKVKVIDKLIQIKYENMELEQNIVRWAKRSLSGTDVYDPVVKISKQRIDDFIKHIHKKINTEKYIKCKHLLLKNRYISAKTNIKRYKIRQQLLEEFSKGLDKKTKQYICKVCGYTLLCEHETLYNIPQEYFETMKDDEGKLSICKYCHETIAIEHHYGKIYEDNKLVTGFAINTVEQDDIEYLSRQILRSGVFINRGALSPEKIAYEASFIASSLRDYYKAKSKSESLDLQVKKYIYLSATYGFLISKLNLSQYAGFTINYNNTIIKDCLKDQAEGKNKDNEGQVDLLVQLMVCIAKNINQSEYNFTKDVDIRESTLDKKWSDLIRYSYKKYESKKGIERKIVPLFTESKTKISHKDFCTIDMLLRLKLGHQHTSAIKKHKVVPIAKKGKERIATGKRGGKSSHLYDLLSEKSLKRLALLQEVFPNPTQKEEVWGPFYKGTKELSPELLKSEFKDVAMTINSPSSKYFPKGTKEPYRVSFPKGKQITYFIFCDSGSAPGSKHIWQGQECILCKQKYFDTWNKSTNMKEKDIKDLEDLVIERRAIDYYKEKCSDDSPHYLSENLCLNCGLTYDEILKPKNIKDLVKAYRKHLESVAKLEDSAIEGKLSDISLKEKTIKYIKFKKGVDEAAFEKLVDKLRNHIDKDFPEKLRTVGTLTNKMNEALGNAKTSTEKENIVLLYEKQRFNFLKSCIESIVVDISILTKATSQYDLEQIDVGESLEKYIGAKLSNVSGFQQKLVSLASDPDLSDLDKSEIAFNIFVELCLNVATGLPKLIAEYLTTKVHLSRDLDMTYSYIKQMKIARKYKKLQRDIVKYNLSPEIKIEYGLSKMSREEQIEFLDKMILEKKEKYEQALEEEPPKYLEDPEDYANEQQFEDEEGYAVVDESFGDRIDDVEQN